MMTDQEIQSTLNRQPEARVHAAAHVLYDLFHANGLIRASEAPAAVAKETGEPEDVVRPVTEALLWSTSIRSPEVLEDILRELQA
jgi:hypothetical protein